MNMQIGLNPQDSWLFSPRSASIFRQSLGTKTSLRREYNQPQFNFTASPRTCVCVRSVCVCMLLVFGWSSVCLLCSFSSAKSLSLLRFASFRFRLSKCNISVWGIYYYKKSLAWLPAGAIWRSVTQEYLTFIAGTDEFEWILSSRTEFGLCCVPLPNFPVISQLWLFKNNAQMIILKRIAAVNVASINTL